MKKLLIIVLAFSLCLLSSCKKNYQITENAEEISSGSLGKYGFNYQGNILYDLPNHTYVIKLKEGCNSGLITIYQKQLDKWHEVTGYKAVRSIHLKKDQTYLIYLNDLNYYDDETKKVVTVKGEVISLSDGISIYIDATKQ